MRRLEGKYALITGASRGIGAAIARRFAQEGANLILAARSVPDLEAVDDQIKQKNPSASVTLVPIDLSFPAQIEEMIRSIAGRFGKLDILIGNAGLLGTLGPITHLPSTDWASVLDINLTANWHLLRLTDSLLKKSDHGRAIFVTSAVGERIYPYWGIYAVSKTALECMVKMYAQENLSSSVKANLVSPGSIRTRMRAQAMPGEDPLTLPHPDDIMDIFVYLASSQVQESGKVFRPSDVASLST